MGADNFEELGCLCAFLDSLGDFKQVFVGIMDAAIGILQTIKALIALVPQDFSDQLEKIGLELGLSIMEQAVQPIQAPLVAVNAYVAPWADCPPVASVAKTIKDVKDFVVGKVQDMRDEVEAMIDALNLQGQKIEQLDNLITLLQDFKDGINYCGA